MATMAGQVALAAGVLNSNIIVGQVYEILPFDCMVEIALVSSVAGTRSQVTCDTEVLLQDVGQENVLVKATQPIYPDDYLVEGVCAAGARLIISGFNAAAATLRYNVRISPL